jgi:hypothetical protein
MPRCGPAITHAELDVRTVQVYADGDPLLQLRLDALRRVWLLPYPGADHNQRVFPTAAKALKQIMWDAEHLSHTTFAHTYPRFVPCVARSVNDTTWTVDRAGTLLATIIRDPDTHRWVILGPDRAQVRMPAAPGGWNFPQSAAEYVMSNVTWFLIGAEAQAASS